MFVQCIQGPVADAAGLRRQFDRWLEELRPDAVGWLGSTGGITADGTFFLAARFESPEAAQRNSERAEQGAWWAETEKYFAGDVTFADYDEVELINDGGSDTAGFVQVIQGVVNDREEMRQLMAGSTPSDERDDVIGGYVANRPDGSYHSIVYFTSEEAARAGEQRDAADGDEFAERMQALHTTPPTFLDLASPWLHTA